MRRVRGKFGIYWNNSLNTLGSKGLTWSAQSLCLCFLNLPAWRNHCVEVVKIRQARKYCFMSKALSCNFSWRNWLSKRFQACPRSHKAIPVLVWLVRLQWLTFAEHLPCAKDVMWQSQDLHLDSKSDSFRDPNSCYDIIYLSGKYLRTHPMKI